MSLMGFFFFGLFAVVQVFMYIGIRRGWLPVGVTVGVGVALSLILPMLMSSAEGNTIGHALLVGLLLGGTICALTLGLAWYFHQQTGDTTQA